MMQFFRKNYKSTDNSAAENELTTQHEAMPENEFSSHLAQTNVPSKAEIDSMVKEEARKLRVTENLLSEPHLQRVKDNLKLNETKLRNVEDNLTRIRQQKERLRRYKELQGEIELQHVHLFELNKQVASMLNDKKELERFETFENVQGRFQRLQIIEQQRHEEKVHDSALTNQIGILTRELDKEQKLLAQRLEEAQDSETAFLDAQTSITQAARLEGSIDAHLFDHQKAVDYAMQLQIWHDELEKNIREQAENIEQLKKEVEKNKIKLQSTESHQRMIQHSEYAIEMLNKLQKQSDRLTASEQKLKDATNRQRTENELLSRIFSDYQQLEANIKTTRDELSVHRQTIHGWDGYQLQERAMRLKRRRQMLKSAYALWQSIQHHYTLIENKNLDINNLRLQKEHIEENIRSLETRLGILRKEHKEKEYTFTLSKSQNVIQLRSDLKEGVSCTVCGATHHPYHSDTILDQNKLIGELKTEAEMLQTELRNKECEMQELLISRERINTKKEEAENVLILLRDIQNKAVEDWKMYVELDNSFASCDSSTNAEARTAMLRHLIENISGDVEKSQDELDMYNFHQSRIIELSDTLSQYEQKRNELTIRMNEINTSCQVLVREVEWLTNRRQDIVKSYDQVCERLDKIMTFPDWLNTWKRSHEGTIMRIQEIGNERQMLEQELHKLEHELDIAEHEKQINEANLQNLTQKQHLFSSITTEFEFLADEDRKELIRYLQGMTSKEYYEKLYLQQAEKRVQLEEQRITEREKNNEFLLARGRQDELREKMPQTDALASTERSALDVWMRQFNATHSPVQYSELEQFFKEEHDWTQIRERIRTTDIDQKLTQAKVDYLKSQLVALQAEGNILSGEASESVSALVKQEEALETKRTETMLLVAKNTLALEAHAKAEAQIKSEKMKE